MSPENQSHIQQMLTGDWRWIGEKIKCLLYLYITVNITLTSQWRLFKTTSSQLTSSLTNLNILMDFAITHCIPTIYWLRLHSSLILYYFCPAKKSNSDTIKSFCEQIWPIRVVYTDVEQRRVIRLEKISTHEVVINEFNLTETQIYFL